MRAAVLHRPAPASTGPLAIERREPLIPAPSQVVVEIAACAVCRTDLQLCEGDLAARVLPIVPGHQIVGRVVALGSGVEQLSLGERVGVAWLARACGVCRFCASGRENLCENALFTGWDRDGGFADQALADARFVHRLPEGLDDTAIAPLLCGGAIGYRSLRISGIEPGQRLGLYGFGASATIVIQIARHWGCEVFVSTRGEREQQRALQLGAVWAGSYSQRPPVALDAAITFAPSGDVVLAALRSIDRGAVVAINAIHLDHVPEFDYSDLWWERSLRSVANVTRRDVAELLDLAATVPLVATVELFAFDEVNTALAALARGTVSGAGVLRM